MTSTDLRAFRNRLVKLVQRLGGESEELRKEAAASTTTEQHTDDDLSREEAEEEVTLAVLGNEEQLLAECRAAIARLDAGSFGKCAACGKAIARPRLDAAPYARDCIRCAKAK